MVNPMTPIKNIKKMTMRIRMKIKTLMLVASMGMAAQVKTVYN